VTNLHDMLLIGYISRSMLDDVLAKVRNAKPSALPLLCAESTIAASLSGKYVRHTHTVCVVYLLPRQFGGGRPQSSSAEYTPSTGISSGWRAEGLVEYSATLQAERGVGADRYARARVSRRVLRVRASNRVFAVAVVGFCSCCAVRALCCMCAVRVPWFVW
jgi:hypothetical protein